ncbi:Aldo/keto reductase family protein [Halorientalis persicus]|uniref:Aldo/keto reductase family protein n=2 Tax=Halorientalis persicus TaxID=1367881 RepID=A0A1H8MTJ7_9EURY|nr:Aldo/keto reductase family protein [Halorientalis persicus]
MPHLQGGGDMIDEQLGELAAEAGVTMARIDLAWFLRQNTIDVTIIGTTRIEYLEDAVGATDLGLSNSEIESLEEPYEPLPVASQD